MATKTIARAHSGNTQPLKDEDFFDILAHAPATLTLGQHQELEAKIKELDDSDGQWRRLALAYLTKPGRELIEAIQHDDAFASSTAEVDRALGEYIGRVKELLALLRQAQGRILVMLATRADMDGLVAQAEKPAVLQS